MSPGRRRQMEPELWLSYREIPKGPSIKSSINVRV